MVVIHSIITIYSQQLQQQQQQQQHLRQLTQQIQQQQQPKQAKVAAANRRRQRERRPQRRTPTIKLTLVWKYIYKGVTSVFKHSVSLWREATPHGCRAKAHLLNVRSWERVALEKPAFYR